MGINNILALFINPKLILIDIFRAWVIVLDFILGVIQCHCVTLVVIDLSNLLKKYISMCLKVRVEKMGINWWINGD